MRSMWMIYGFLFACMLCSSPLVAQDLQVLVLDALSGRPQANVDVQYLHVPSTQYSAQEGPDKH